MTWFIHSEDRILGPFSTKKVQDQLKAGKLSYGCYIWAKGHVEWMALSDWEANLSQYLDADTPESRPKTWKIRIQGDLHENLDFEKAIVFLKKFENLRNISISPQGDDQWIPIYSSYLFMDALNLSRRNFLRAPLMGLTKVSRQDSRFSYVAKCSTIGEGGMGVYGLGSNFEVGAELQLKLESEDLSTSLKMVGKVVYLTDTGFAGIAYKELKEESKAIIVDYLNRFQEIDTPISDAS